ncbi:polysaccharide biosynthesis/export family protein [Cupriavidus sp. CuC1]|uniref:polysaccharide biosynthesis/export family protein n=1 Tax=Cupriavidus sp. CuC1 TaxID=3373131 RepID=UPI0037D1872A
MFKPSSLPSFRRALLLLGTVPLLASCALAPGMRFDPLRPLDPEDPNSVPKVTQITPDLLRAMKASSKPVNEGVEEIFGTPQPYKVGIGDILSVVVWDHPELVFPTQTYSIGSAYEAATFGGGTLSGYLVSPDGEIQFPYAGVVKVVNKTPSEIRGDLSKQLKDVINLPQITVRVLGYRSKRVYLDGEVKTPGPQTIDDVPMTLIEAINRSGGINVATGDSSSIRVARGGKNYSVNLPALLQQGIDPAKILLRNGDIVRVEPREDSRVFVTGEVLRPSTVLPRNGRLTLNEALGEAGGVNPISSDAKAVYVIRKSADNDPQVFHLDGKSPVAMALAESFELKPKDVVYVDAAGVVRWSRVINQLIPSGSFLNSTATSVSR